MRLGADFEVKSKQIFRTPHRWIHHDTSENVPKQINIVFVSNTLKFTNLARYSEDGAQQWVKDYTKDFQIFQLSWAASARCGCLCSQEYGERIAEFNAKRGPAA